MIVGRHQNTARVLGKPPAWYESIQGVCPGLPVSDIVTPVGPAMESVWHPTPDELGRRWFLRCSGRTTRRSALSSANRRRFEANHRFAFFLMY